MLCFKHNKKWMEYFYEIVDALYERYKISDIDELCELLKILDELYQSTGDYNFRKELEKLCDDNRICKKCLSGKVVDVIVGYQNFDGWRMPEYSCVCSECGMEY